MVISRGLLPLIAVVVGAGLMAWAAVAGLGAPGDGSGSDPGAFIAAFILGAVLLIVGATVPAVRMRMLFLRTGSCREPLPWVTVLLALAGAITMLVLVMVLTA